MRGDIFLAHTLGQMPRHAFGQPAGVHEHERGAVFANQFGQPIVDLRPHLSRHHGLERRRRKFQGQIPAPRVAGVDDGAGPADTPVAGATRDRLSR